MKKQLLIAAGMFLAVHAAISQNAGINNDGSAPETGVMLDIKGTNPITATGTQTVFQGK